MVISILKYDWAGVSGVAVLSAFFYYLLYMCTFNTELLFEVHIHGLSGYLAGETGLTNKRPEVIHKSGVSIAVKQVMPDHILARTPLGKITNRNIPLSVFGLTFIMWAIGNRRLEINSRITPYIQEWLRDPIAQCLEQASSSPGFT